MLPILDEQLVYAFYPGQRQQQKEVVTRIICACSYRNFLIWAIGAYTGYDKGPKTGVIFSGLVYCFLHKGT